MRVCPFCGEAPGPGVFCAACGRNLAAVERLPTREAWEAGRGAAGNAAPLPAGEGPAPMPPGGEPAPPPDSAGLATRNAAAIGGFLEAMHAAGDPGTEKMLVAGGWWTRHRRGWIVRPVDREDLEGPRRYEPGLFLTVEGTLHRLDSEIRGWGQRDFPVFSHSITADPLPPPPDPQLADELEGLLAQRTGSTRPPPSR